MDERFSEADHGRINNANPRIASIAADSPESPANSQNGPPKHHAIPVNIAATGNTPKTIANIKSTLTYI